MSILKEVNQRPNVETITGWSRQEISTISTEIYCVRIDKTTGDAANRVKPVIEEDGFRAHQVMHTWFKQTSQMAICERVRKRMHPATAKKEEDVLMCVEAWRKEMEELEREYPDGRYVLTQQMKKVALTAILTGEVKHWLDMDEADWESEDVTYESLYHKVHTRAHRKRIQSVKDTGGRKDMDIGKAGELRSNKEDENWYEWYGQWDQGYWDENGEWKNPEADEIGAVGKGKSGKSKGSWKGKGGKGYPGKGKTSGNEQTQFRGNCYHCGKKGHSKGNCPDLGYGFKRDCLKCGVRGQRSNQCPIRAIEENDDEEEESKSIRQVGDRGDEWGLRPDLGRCYMVKDREDRMTMESLKCEIGQAADVIIMQIETEEDPEWQTAKPSRCRICAHHDRLTGSALMQIEKKNKQKVWKRPTACADSGATRSVAPQRLAPDVSVRETNESREGKSLIAANGSDIKIY